MTYVIILGKGVYGKSKRFIDKIKPILKQNKIDHKIIDCTVPNPAINREMVMEVYRRLDDFTHIYTSKNRVKNNSAYYKRRNIDVVSAIRNFYRLLDSPGTTITKLIDYTVEHPYILKWSIVYNTKNSNIWVGLKEGDIEDFLDRITGKRKFRMEDSRLRVLEYDGLGYLYELEETENDY